VTTDTTVGCMRSTMIGIRSKELDPLAEGSTEGDACSAVVVPVSLPLESPSPWQPASSSVASTRPRAIRTVGD
jgi:hypothetical protein